MGIRAKPIASNNMQPLYDYYSRVSTSIPYWDAVRFDIWQQSMFSDIDADGERLFRELHTYIACRDGEITGFIQFGKPSFIYNAKGKKQRRTNAGIIRNLYFAQGDTDVGEHLLQVANEYFAKKRCKRRWAFYHVFGMTCNARHGKLYESCSHIESLLHSHNYVKEHENVYYKRPLSNADTLPESGIRIAYGTVSPQGFQNFQFYADNKCVGNGALQYLPQGEQCFLTFIGIERSQQHKGYGTASLRQLFSDLAAQGIRRIDTDTADDNIRAQGLYIKTGFTDMGRTRSYIFYK